MPTILHGDCLDLLPTVADNSIDAIVTDPPYCLDSIRKRFGSPTAKPTNARQHRGIARGFMGHTWDDDIAFRTDVWRECLRVLKPGGYMVAFGGCRTYHRLVTAIEDAGFVIHPMLAWAFGTGFPKATNASKMIDKHLGAERALVGTVRRWGNAAGKGRGGQYANEYEPSIEGAERYDAVTAPGTPEAAQWEGWSYGLQSLKPSLESICMAQKPMIGTGAQNILEWGVGAVNTDACRVPTSETLVRPMIERLDNAVLGAGLGVGTQTEPLGRWPSNLLHDGSDEVVGCFPQSDHARGNKGASKGGGGMYGHGLCENSFGAGDEGSAARFFPTLDFSEDERRLFYQSKASKRDRAGSSHPTVKPVKLMEWLCRLITPPGGLILDPFAGSGSTGQAAQNLGFDCILIEREDAYIEDIRRRFADSR